jgi:hypothetical protein
VWIAAVPALGYRDDAKVGCKQVVFICEGDKNAARCLRLNLSIDCGFAGFQ